MGKIKLPNKKCIDDSSSSSVSESYGMSHQNTFNYDDDVELRIHKESPDDDDFMNKIIQENNKNTYRWEFPQKSKSDPVFADLVVEEADEELTKITETARVALGREDD